MTDTPPSSLLSGRVGVTPRDWKGYDQHAIGRGQQRAEYP
jgi:hypothetical protein